MSKKILFVFYTLEAGGAERSLISIGNKLSEKDDYNIDFFIFQKSSTLEPLISKKINIIHSNSVEKKGIIEYFRKFILFGFRLSLVPNISGYNYIVAIHEHFPEIAVWSVRFFRFWKWNDIKQKSILIVHFSPKVYIRTRDTRVKQYLHMFLYKFRNNNFSKIITISRQLYYEHKINNSIPEFIYNPIDISAIKAMSSEKIKLVSSPFFVHIGSIQMIKNQDFIIDSLIKVGKELEFEILFIGRVLEQRYYEFLLKKIKNSKINIKVKFMGELNNPFPLLKRSLGLINVSQYESFSYVVHEAMVLKIPVISFLKEENKFISTKNVISIKETATEFVDTLNQIYYKKIDTKFIAEQAYSYVQKFNIDRIVEKYDKLFAG